MTGHDGSRYCLVLLFCSLVGAEKSAGAAFASVRRVTAIPSAPLRRWACCEGRRGSAKSSPCAFSVGRHAASERIVEYSASWTFPFTSKPAPRRGMFQRATSSSLMLQTQPPLKHRRCGLTRRLSSFFVRPRCSSCGWSNIHRSAGFLSRGDSISTSLSSSSSLPESSSAASSSSSSSSSSTSTTTSNNSNRLDDTLSKLTSLFPLYVVLAAIAAYALPRTFTWVNRGSIISLLLASVMMGTGMTLEKKDFTSVLSQQFTSVPLGILCQFLIMPAAACLVGRSLLLSLSTSLPNTTTTATTASWGPTLFLGLALVGCSPGGTASNLVSLIARADVALSVLLTACSTLLAAAVTPLLVKVLVGSTVCVSGRALCAATAKVVLLPVVLGMTFNAKLPKVSKALSRFTPLASAWIVAFICGGVVAQNAPMMKHSFFSSSLRGSSTGSGGGAAAAAAVTNAMSQAATPSLMPRIIGSVLALHTIGFVMGYLIPKYIFRRTDRTARTISIETGMQNSALAVVLARSIGAHPLACLPGALSATAHSCLGSILAAYWRFIDDERNRRRRRHDTEEEEDGGTTK